MQPCDQAQFAHAAGKTTHLAQLMKDQGCVIALDRSHAKAQHIRLGPPFSSLLHSHHYVAAAAPAPAPALGGLAPACSAATAQHCTA